MIQSMQQNITQIQRIIGCGMRQAGIIPTFQHYPPMPGRPGGTIAR